MKCTDCGMPLDGVTIQSSGYLECPQCGKTIQSNDDARDEHRKSLQADCNRFEMVEFIGQGTSGTVYKAFDKELHRYVAIKTPRDNAPNYQSEVLLKEARNASQLHHPNIVTIHDVIQLESSIHIVSEYIEGSSLKVWLDRHEHDVETACSIVSEICRAVAFAHQADVIHRDIKPANIVMDLQNKPHLLDFGLSYSRQSRSLSPKRAGIPVGTPAFMSPEQVKGDLDKIDHRTDIYSIGVVLYQMLTDRLPFSGSGDELYAKIVGETPLSPRQINHKIPASLDAIVMRAMAKEPSSRYSDANQLAEDIENYLQGRKVKAYGKLELRNIKHFARRRFAAGLAVSSVAGLAGMSWWMSDPTQVSKGTVEPQLESELKNVVIEIDGSPGRLYCQRLRPEDGQLETERLDVEGGREIKLRPGFYRFTYENADEVFYVYRTIPEQNVRPLLKVTGVKLPHRNWFLYRKHIELPPIVVKPTSQIQSNMSNQAGGTLKPSQAGVTFANVAINVESFLIDRHEVLMDDLLEALDGLVRLEEDEIAGVAVKVSFEHALAYAEKTGKQIQTAWQWLYACTNGGVTKFPWGSTVDTQSWPLVANADQFDNKSSPPVSSLYSGVLEWADTTPPQLPKIVMDQLGESPYKVEPLRLRAIVGGPLDFAKSKELELAKSNNPMLFAYETTTNFYSNVGIRCTRNLKTKASPQ